MLELTFTLPAGRGASALAKLAAVAFSLFAGVVCLYGMNLIYFGNLYGMGSLSRSVQSLPSLVSCIWRLNIGQYIMLFVFGKWLGAVAGQPPCCSRVPALWRAALFPLPVP